ncbi:hypothetical protein WA556_003557, partial [Blastocystis sp. ATCC 50177/Nand II]
MNANDSNKGDKEESIKADLSKYNTSETNAANGGNDAAATNSSKPAMTIKVFFIKLMIILVLVAFLYLVQFLNSVLKDKLDATLSLYPRQWKRLWAIFTCPFIHDDYKHLNSIILLFTACAFFVLLRGNLRFLWVSIIVLILGNFGSWLFGVNRMNGVSEWMFGLLGYIYFSVITDLGYPIHCTIHGLKALALAVAITVVWVLLWQLHIIVFTTACWQYNVCGAVAGVVSAYLFTSTSLAVKLGVISKERLQESVAQPVAAPPEEVKRRVVVPKHLISFNDLRKPL